MIDCQKAQELANAYIDNVLSDADCTAYEEHISCCDKCHEEYDMLKKITSDLAQTVSPLPEGFAKRMHTALVKEQFEAQSRKDKKKFVFPYFRAASVMAAALIIAVVGKVGVYDTYKKVTEDTVRVASEISTNAVSQPVAKTAEPVAKTEPKNTDTTFTDIKDTPQKESEPTTAPDVRNITPVTREVKTFEPTPTQTESAETTAEVVPAEAVAEAVPQIASEVESAPVAEATYTDEAADNAISPGNMMRIMTPDEIPAEPTEESANYSVSKMIPNTIDETSEIAEEPVSAGGSAPESVSAEVSIHSSDGSKMMLKKYLLTILDGSKISDNGDEITITVDEDEYSNVMEHLRANEYVKSVTEGTPQDGTVVINIK